jgi:CHASE1-domain containing sensor protein
MAFRATLKWEPQKIETGFQLAAEDRFSVLEREIESNLETLLALKAFYSPSQKIIRSQFRDFVASLLSHHPSIKALEWIPLVIVSQREAYEAAAKRDGFSDFKIAERQPQGEMVRATRFPAPLPGIFTNTNIPQNSG